MRVLQICNSDSRGGAAIASMRLHDALREKGIDSRQYSLHDHRGGEYSTAPTSYLKKAWRRTQTEAEQRLLKTTIRNSSSPCSLSLLPTFNIKQLKSIQADIYHLHWPNRGLLSVYDLQKLDKPILWTLHDEWAFTDCRHYTMPDTRAISSNLIKKLSSLKMEAMKKVSSQITWVCLNNWMKERLLASELEVDTDKVHVIGNPVSQEVFKHADNTSYRKQRNIPSDAFVILYGAINSATDLRKGSDLLSSAVDKFVKSVEVTRPIYLINFGSEKQGLKDNGKYKELHLGKITSSKEMAEVYNLADVFMCPSRLDNQPNTISESQACGRPVIGFAVGGVTEMIKSAYNGYIIDPFDITDMSMKIKNLYLDEKLMANISKNAIHDSSNSQVFESRVTSIMSLYKKLQIQSFKK